MAALGVNLTDVTYWHTQEPFIDRFLTHGAWKIDGNDAAVVPVDSLGNPLSMPNGAKSIWTMIAVDPVAADPIDQYVLTYDGTVTGIKITNSKIISTEPGKIVFEVTSPTAVSVQLTFKGMSEADPIHDVHVVRADQVDLFKAGEIFNPAFVENASEFSVLRFMGWTRTIGSSISDWSDRTTLDDSSWSRNASTSGVPVEALVRLANEAHSDMWYNIPTQADDNYVRQALGYIRDHLDPSLKLHVEYSNEVWNWSFPAASYAQAQANAMWGNGGGDVQGGWMVYYGYRAAQIAAIGNALFGADADRLVNVIGGQTGNPNLTTYYTVDGIARAGVGTVSALFSDYAVTTYFGGQVGRDKASDEAIVLGWARSGAAGMDAAFKELEFGGALSSDLSLARLKQYYAVQAGIAEQYGLNLVAYEGGASLTAVNFPKAQQAEVIAFFDKLMADPRMGALYAKMAADFAAAGGSELNVYADVDTNAENGNWGLLPTIYDTSSPRYDALLDWAAQGDSYAAMDATSSVSANGSASADVISGTSGNDMIHGGAGNDLIKGSSSTVNKSGAYTETDFYQGGGGADTIVGGTGNDHIYGNASDSAAGAVDGDDSLYGGGGNDYIQGNAGNDSIDGGTGNDRIYGGGGNDQVLGGAGVDYAQGNKGNDSISGGAGNDVVRGGADNDTLAGDAGDDNLVGDAGDDLLTGGAGLDQLTGGVGADLFIFGAKDATFVTSGSQAYRMDEITDFAPGQDHIQLAGLQSVHVVQSAAGSVAAALTWAGKALAAHSGEDYVAAVSVGVDTYLFYDKDGVGGAVDAGIKVDHIAATAFAAGGTDFV